MYKNLKNKSFAIFGNNHNKSLSTHSLKKYNKIVGSGLVCLLSSAPLLAADLPSREPPPYVQPVYEQQLTETDWSGFYVGVTVGAAWAKGDVMDSDTPAYVAATQNVSYSTEGKAGVLGGVYAGYNIQPSHMNGLVVGVEADIVGTSAKAELKHDNDYPLHYMDGTSELKWFGSVRGRVGYTWNNSTLVYGTAGVGFGGVDRNYTDLLNSVSMKHNKTDWGYVVGAGAEGKWTDNVIIRGEYLYGKLTDTDTDVHQGRFGISYKF